MLSVSPDFHSVDPADACLLGAPIGERDSIDAVLKQKLDEMKLMGEDYRFFFHMMLCVYSPMPSPCRRSFSLFLLYYYGFSGQCSTPSA